MRTKLFEESGGVLGRPQDWTPGVSDAMLVERAVKNARSRRSNKGVLHPRWVAVMDQFALGSTYAQNLCRRFGIDPDEMVKR